MLELRRVALLCAALPLLLSCGTPGGDADPVDEDPNNTTNTTPNNTTTTPVDPQNPLVEARREALTSISQRVIVPTYEALVTSATTLEAASQAWASAPDDAVARDAARAAWRDTMSVWQRAELFQIGPAGPQGDVIGGADLRDQLYSWPLTNRCVIDRELTQQGYADAPAFFARVLVNVRGLDAMEYLLFREDGANACSPQNAINAQGQWAALGQDEITSRRAAYAATLAADVKARAQTLRAAWSDQGEGWANKLTRSGSPQGAYATTQEALNALSDAMFYLDKEAKDIKLAGPAGIMGCAQDTCPEQLESPLAKHSGQNLAQNMRGFQLLYHGGAPDDADAFGYDDLLRAVGATALADDMSARIASAIEALDGLSPSMEALLESDAQRVVEAHAAVRLVTDLLKTQFVSMLDLELPQRAEGDND